MPRTKTRDRIAHFDLYDISEEDEEKFWDHVLEWADKNGIKIDGGHAGSQREFYQDIANWLEIKDYCQRVLTGDTRDKSMTAMAKRILGKMKRKPRA